MDNVLDLARRLGQEIRGHERYCVLRDAEQKAMADPQALKIQEQLSHQLEKMHDLESQGKPIEVEDKRELARLQGLARSNPALQQLLKVQADYFEMMNRVNRTILNELAPPEEPTKA